MSSTKTEELPKPPPATLDLSTYRLWWEPEPLEPSVDALTTLNDDHSSSSSQAARPLLSDYQVERWLSDGFLALDNIWPAELIARAAREAYAYFPLPDQREEGDRGSELSGSVARRDAQGRLWPSYVNTAPSSARQVSMPFFDLDDVATSPDLAINQIALHSRILSIAAQLLGTTHDDLRCDLNVLRCRYGVAGDAADGNQDMHVGALRPQLCPAGCSRFCSRLLHCAAERSPPYRVLGLRDRLRQSEHGRASPHPTP